MAFDTTVGLTAKDKQGKKWNVKLNESDRSKLAQIVSLANIRTGPSRSGEGAPIRSPWVSVKDVTEDAIRTKYTKRGLNMIPVSHLILELAPAGERVRYIDGNPLNLVRENLRPYGSPDAPRRQRREKPNGTPAQKPKPNGKHTNGHADPQEMALVREQRDVWVVRIGKREEVFVDKQLAVNHFATVLTERVR
jgi:hypothetical protein